MSESLHCPDCGHANPATAKACEQCNFPLDRLAETEAASAVAGTPEAETPEAPDAPLPMRPLRPRRARSADNKVQMQIILVTAAMAAVLLVVTAMNGFKQSNSPTVEGAKPDQQKLADVAREALAKDSTNTPAHIALGNVLYDTGNWSEAIVHYKAALRSDSTESTVWTDLGVCYYNLSQFADSRRYFERALSIDPHQPVALFNIGVLEEGQGHLDEALSYYHRAMQSSPPEGMKAPLMTRMQEVMGKLGKSAPPVPGLEGEAPAPGTGR